VFDLSLLCDYVLVVECKRALIRGSVCLKLFLTNIAVEKRAAEAKRILTKYPDRIPVIVEKSARSTLPEIDKKKFLVPGSMLCGEFKYIIHKHLQSQLSTGAEFLSAEQTLYLFVKNTPPRTGMMIA
jgi:GABA(A) receptor-associated protein